MVAPKGWKTEGCEKGGQEAPLPVLSAGDFSLNEENSTAVVSNAYKFVIPVPGNSSDRALIFFNDRDQSWQAVSGDGTGVIIINEVTPAQAAQLDQKVRSLVPFPAKLTFNQIKELLAYSRTALSLGDIYNSTRDYVAQKLVVPPAQRAFNSETDCDPRYGLSQRIDSDIYQAAYVPAAFAFSGVAASDQIFAQGGVLLEQQGQQRSLQPDVFVRTYRLASGAPIDQLATDIAHLHIPLSAPLNIENSPDHGDG